MVSGPRRLPLACANFGIASASVVSMAAAAHARAVVLLFILVLLSNPTKPNSNIGIARANRAAYRLVRMRQGKSACAASAFTRNGRRAGDLTAHRILAARHP